MLGFVPQPNLQKNYGGVFEIDEIYNYKSILGYFLNFYNNMRTHFFYGPGAQARGAVAV